MHLQRDTTAVVTGAASGIGLALSTRFAHAGMNVVMADVEADALAAAADQVSSLGVQTMAVACDVRHAERVEALAEATKQRFGPAAVVCNNAGVTGGGGDPWLGPLNSWEWTIGVNLYGVIHGVRAFIGQISETRGHFVNTASVAGLYPGLSPAYDATKHAVVALTEDLYRQSLLLGGTFGVSCLCPGWVRTNIARSERNFPDDLGALQPGPMFELVRPMLDRVIAEGASPASVADAVVEAIEVGRFWVFTDPQFIDVALARWHTIADGTNPQPPEHLPGMDELRAMLDPT